MLRKSILSLAAALMLGTGIGCEQTISGLGGKPSPVMPIGESHFLKVVANADREEIEMSKIALQRSHNDQVRQFAQQMIDDHSKDQQNLQQLASSKGAVLPAVLGNIEQGAVSNLATQSDANFDQAYIDGQIMAHQDTINNVNAEAMNGADVDVKSYAQHILPTLQHHLLMAKQLKGVRQ